MKIIRGELTQFELTNPDGSALNAKSVGVTCVNGDGPIWWIVSDEYSETWDAVSVNELIGKAAEEARAQLDQLETKSGARALSRITYGQVPAGFRQVVPEQGPPEPLEQGRSYVLHAVGKGFGVHQFEF